MEKEEYTSRRRGTGERRTIVPRGGSRSIQRYEKRDERTGKERGGTPGTCLPALQSTFFRKRRSASAGRDSQGEAANRGHFIYIYIRIYNLCRYIDKYVHACTRARACVACVHACIDIGIGN